MCLDQLKISFYHYLKGNIILFQGFSDHESHIMNKMSDLDFFFVYHKKMKKDSILFYHYLKKIKSS